MTAPRSEHILVWEFRVHPGCEADFEATYGPTGAWVALFAASPGFLGTELLRDPAVPGRYLTIDRWTSAEAFADFQRAHRSEYDALDARCEPWTEAEIRLGSWVLVGAG